MRGLRVLAAAILLGIAAPAPARADTVYAYWSYWQGDSGAWQYATVGPATAPAVDGSVDGWRFTLGSDGRAAQPAASPDFAAICGATPKQAGRARVAIVLDFAGLADGAPSMRCAIVEEGLSRASALTSVAALRLQNGFVCAIDGLPASGCGDAVGTHTTPPSSPATPDARATASPPAPGPKTSTAANAGTPAGAPATAEPAATAPTATPAAAATADSATTSSTSNGSPISTVLTFLLGGIAVALAVRNGRRQLGQR